MKKSTDITIVCGVCGSEDVLGTATVRWSNHRQQWKIVDVLAEVHCCECENQGPLEEKYTYPLPEFLMLDEFYAGKAPFVIYEDEHPEKYITVNHLKTMWKHLNAQRGSAPEPITFQYAEEVCVDDFISKQVRIDNTEYYDQHHIIGFYSTDCADILEWYKVDPRTGKATYIDSMTARELELEISKYR